VQDKTGFAVFAHGSKVESANDAVRAMADQLARDGSYNLVEAAFLESAEPDLNGAVDRLVARGATRVVVIPYFLTLGTHLQRDLPRLVERVAAAHPGIAIEASPPLDGHEALARILLDRARESLGE